jgi:hypothetical protein
MFRILLSARKSVEKTGKGSALWRKLLLLLASYLYHLPRYRKSGLLFWSNETVENLFSEVYNTCRCFASKQQIRKGPHPRSLSLQ